MKPWPLPAVVAHRCGGTLAPENTLIGLEFAVQHHCAAVEFDAMLSGSATPILIHDETLRRTTNGRGSVCAMPDEQLFRLDAGSWKSPRFAGERIPSLFDALSRCAALGLGANVEVKPAAGFDQATGHTVATLCAAFAPKLALLLSSFSAGALEAAREVAPDLPRALLVEWIPSDWTRLAFELDLDGFVCDTRHLGQARAQTLREAGLGLAVYTENDPQRAAMLFAWGVQSVITDRPDLLGTAL